MPSLYETTAIVGDVSSSNFTTLYNSSGLSAPNAGGGTVSGNFNVAGNLTVQGTSLLQGAVTLGSTLSLPHYAFPSGDGTTDQVLATDGSGNLYFTNVSTLGANYTIQADTVVGGANLSLISSTGIIDSVKLAGSGGITVSRVDANTININGADPLPVGTKGDVLYNDGTAWVAENVIQADTSAQRTTYQYNNSTAGPASPLLLMRNFGASTYASGDGTTLNYSVTSNSQGTKRFGLVGALYDAVDPTFTVRTSIDNFATNTEVIAANTTSLGIAAPQILFDKDAVGTRYLQWSTANNQFELSNSIYVGGDVAATGQNVTVNVDNTAGDSYLNYGSGVGVKYLKWNNTATQFELNDDLLIDKATPFLTFATQAQGINQMYGIRGTSAQDDPWFVGAGSIGVDSGYLEIATGDNAGVADSASPIYVRQYNGYASGGAPWYGGNGTVVSELILLDGNGNTVIPRDLAVNGGDITTTETGTANLYNNSVIGVVNIGNGVSSEVNIGGISTTRVQIKPNTIVGANTTQNVFNTVATTVNAFGAATTVSIGADTGTTTVNNTLVADHVNVSGNLVANKGVYAKGIMDAAFTDGIVADYATGNARISTGAADTLSFYNNGVANTLLGQFSTAGNLAITGDLQVNGNDIKSSTGASAITLSGTTTNLNGTLNVQTASTAGNISIGSVCSMLTAQVITTSTATTPLIFTGRKSMKAMITITDNVTGALHTVELLLLKNGATAMMTTYAELYTSAALATFTADLSAGSIRILATPASANSTTFDVVRTSLS
jgi:hypothetical protein